MNGEFFDFDLDSLAVNVHSSAGSNMVMSAEAPTRSTPASFQPITLAGLQESQRTTSCGSPAATISAIGMGSVISANAIDAAVAKAIPHCLSIGFGAERWVHLAVGVVVTDLFVSEQEMMWRNFTGHLHSLLSSLANLFKRCI